MPPLNQEVPISGGIPTILAAVALFAGGPTHSAAAEKCGGHEVTAKQTRPFRAKTWRLDRWRRGAPPKKIRKAHGRHVRCAAGPRHRKAMRHGWKKRKRAYNAHRRAKLAEQAELAQISSVTPYNCGSHGSYAIPCYIVECESHFSWSAANPSGAIGPYQLLGHGAPWPVTSLADKLAHHRIARELWMSQGSSPWVCA